MKSKIDTSGWKEFKIGDLFDVVKGTRLTKADMKQGDYRFIGSSAINNGVTAYIDNEEHIHTGNKLTVCYNGSIGETFYQDLPFWASDDVNVLYPKTTMSRNVCMFIAPIIKCISKKYSYVNKWRQDVMQEEYIRLPVTDEGLPDFDYMDAYMSRIFEEEESFVDKLEEKDFSGNKIDTSKWKEFKIGQLFNIVKPPVLHDRQVYCSENGLPYVVRTKFNNGIKSIVTTNVKIEPSPAGVITWGAENASFFYQDKPFYSGRDIYYLETKKLDKNSCLFIISTMSKIAEKYQYNYGLFPDLLKNEIIRLPATDEGLPDFDYMDTYMQRIIDEEEAVADKITEE